MSSARLWSLVALAVSTAACLAPPTRSSSPSSYQRSSSSRSLSPSEPYGWRNAVIIGGGFVSSIIFSRKVEGLAYARTDVGGAYRFDPGTEAWRPLLDWVG